MQICLQVLFCVGGIDTHQVEGTVKGVSHTVNWRCVADNIKHVKIETVDGLHTAHKTRCRQSAEVAAMVVLANRSIRQSYHPPFSPNRWSERLSVPYAADYRNLLPCGGDYGVCGCKLAAFYLAWSHHPHRSEKPCSLDTPHPPPSAMLPCSTPFFLDGSTHSCSVLARPQDKPCSVRSNYTVILPKLLRKPTKQSIYTYHPSSPATSALRLDSVANNFRIGAVVCPTAGGSTMWQLTGRARSFTVVILGGDGSTEVDRVLQAGTLSVAVCSTIRK